MATTYIDGAVNMRKGIPNAEVGLKVSSISTRVGHRTEILTRDESGEVDGKILSDPYVAITVSGEVVEPAGQAEAANTSILSADYNKDLLTELTSSNDFQNALIHAYTTSNIFHGITVTEFGFTGEIQYTSSREGLTMFTANIEGFPGLTYL